MSDTTKTILWIVLALIVIGLIAWWFARSAAKRRELESRRIDAASLRAQIDEAAPMVQGRSDRASVTGVVAADAQAEADAAAREAQAKADEARRLAEEADRHQRDADGAAAEQERLAREADRLDPDVKTDDEGNRLDDPAERPTTTGSGEPAAASGEPGAASGEPAAVGAAAFTNEEDEPDLADAENPFGDQVPVRAGGATAMNASMNSPMNAPVNADDGDETGAADRTEDADWVNGPVEEESGVDEEQARVDAESSDWVNGPPEDESPGATVDAGDGTDGDEGTGFRGETDAEARADTRVESLDDESLDDESAPADAGPRAISRYDEVTDGGYGVGSAAPISDGAQPLGHPVKAWRDGMRFVSPGGADYEGGQPDVWFFDEAAARRAGFRNTSD